MNLKQIDVAIAAYEPKLDQADNARLAFFRALWGTQAEIAKSAPAAVVTTPSNSDLSACVSKGRPVLACAPIVLDEKVLSQATERITACIIEEGGFPETISQQLQKVKWHRLHAASNRVPAGGNPVAYVEAMADLLLDDGLSEEAASVGAQATSLALRALLEGPAYTLAGKIKKVEAPLSHSLDCPVCGGQAAVVRVGDTVTRQGRGKELWCAQCATTWEFERVRCVRCGTQNQAHLHYFNLEGDDAHRLATCDECKGYVRTVYQADALAPFSFEVEDVIMAKLDLIAYHQALFSSESQTTV